MLSMNATRAIGGLAHFCGAWTKATVEVHGPAVCCNTLTLTTSLLGRHFLGAAIGGPVGFGVGLACSPFIVQQLRQAIDAKAAKAGGLVEESTLKIGKTVQQHFCHKDSEKTEEQLAANQG